MLKILLNFCLDISYKQGEFFKTLLKIGFKFISSKMDSTIAFDLSFMLLPVQLDPVAKEQDLKKDVFIPRATGYIKIIFA